jgi:hypothetical protein
MNLSFVGIAGVSKPHEIIFLQNEARRLGFGNSYTLMLGLFSSHRRIADPSLAGKYSPPAAYLATLASLVEQPASSMVHYCTANPSRIADEITSLFTINDLYATGCHAVQLNIEWPDPAALERILQRMPEMQIGLWISQDMLGMNHAALARRLREYEGLAEYALIDPSGGRGLLLDPKEVGAVMRCIDETVQIPHLGIAGGLRSGNIIDVVSDVQEEYAGKFCTDVETGVKRRDGLLDIAECRRYVRNSAKVLL